MTDSTFMDHRKRDLEDAIYHRVAERLADIGLRLKGEHPHQVSLDELRFAMDMTGGAPFRTHRAGRGEAPGDDQGERQ